MDQLKLMDNGTLGREDTAKTIVVTGLLTPIHTAEQEAEIFNGDLVVWGTPLRPNGRFGKTTDGVTIIIGIDITFLPPRRVLRTRGHPQVHANSCCSAFGLQEENAYMMMVVMIPMAMNMNDWGAVISG